MRRLAQICLIVFALLSIIGVISYLDFQSREKERQQIILSLEQEIQKNRAGEVDFVDFSLFTMPLWDKLYIFRSYSPPEYIDSVLGKYWIESRFTEIESSDRISLLVFTKNGKVVQYLEFPRSQGDFSSAANESGYSLPLAQFSMDKNGQMVWVFANSSIWGPGR
jgi:hypothetical protein